MSVSIFGTTLDCASPLVDGRWLALAPAGEREGLAGWSICCFSSWHRGPLTGTFSASCWPFKDSIEGWMTVRNLAANRASIRLPSDSRKRLCGTWADLHHTGLLDGTLLRHPP